MNIKIANIISVTHLVKPFATYRLEGQHNWKQQGRSKTITIKSEQTFFSLFRTGSIVGKGSKDFIRLQQDILWLESYLFGFGLKLGTYKIVNIVSIAKVSNRKLSLLELAAHMPNSSYDPTPPVIMPRAIIYKPNGSRTLLIYGTGTAVMTGFKTMIDTKEVAKETEKLISDLINKYPEIREGDEK